MMDFAALPPEINSANIYSGPGAGPLLAAAASWDRLAGTLHASATACQSVVTALTTDGWWGPSSKTMAAAAAPYLTWMHGVAALAEQTAVQVKSAAGAYQTALAMAVPPPLIAANRTRLLSLIATNFFGQNGPEIAATEADYDRMWAQDATVMDSYSSASATAATLAPFGSPPTVANQNGAAARAAAETPSQAAPTLSLTNIFNDTVSTASGAASVSSSSFGGASIATTNHAIAINAMRDAHQGIGPFIASRTGFSAPPAATPLAGPAVAAVVGRASIAGALSVPQSWAATTSPTASPAAIPLPDVRPGAAPMVSEALPPGMFGEAMLGTMAGRGASTTAAKLRRSSVIPRSPAAG